MWPGVVESAELIGSTQIQGRASLAGNLCNASPAADTVPALVAAAAVCRIAGPDGTRRIPVEDVCTGPGQLSLGDGEFVVAFELSAPPPRSGGRLPAIHSPHGNGYRGGGRRSEPRARRGGRCTAARVALGAVAPTVVLVEEAGAALLGTQCDDTALEAMAAAARAACRPIDDKRGTAEFRTKVAGVLATRAARIAADRAREAR